MSNEQTKSYLENFKELSDTVNKIESMTVPDVDALVPLVENAVKSLSNCMARIEATEKLLGFESPDQDGA